jgi:hypothetical protein
LIIAPATCWRDDTSTGKVQNGHPLLKLRHGPVTGTCDDGKKAIMKIMAIKKRGGGFCLWNIEVLFADACKCPAEFVARNCNVSPLLQVLLMSSLDALWMHPR